MAGMSSRALSALLLLAAVLTALAGCGLLERTRLLRDAHVVLDGHAYDARLQPQGPARLELRARVLQRSRPRAEPRLLLRGEGTLAIGARRYQLLLSAASPSFLSDMGPHCRDYFIGGGQRAWLDGQEVTIDLHVAAGLDAAYGLVQREPAAGGRRPSTDYGAVCFDEEGKTHWEIWRVDDPAFLAFTLGPEASPPEKLRQWRAQRGW